MSTRSGRVWGPAVLASGDHKLFTVPAGRTLVIRSITCVNVNASARNLRLGVDDSTTSGGKLIRATEIIPAATSVDFQVWRALNPGDELWAWASNATSLQLSVFGALLAGYEPLLPLT